MNINFVIYGFRDSFTKNHRRLRDYFSQLTTDMLDLSYHKSRPSVSFPCSSPNTTTCHWWSRNCFPIRCTCIHPEGFKRLVLFYFISTILFFLYGKGHVGSFYSQNATLCYALYIFLILSASRVVINCYALNCNLYFGHHMGFWNEKHVCALILRDVFIYSLSLFSILCQIWNPPRDLQNRCVIGN